MVLDGTPRKRECQRSGARSQLAQPSQVLRCLRPTPGAHIEMWLLHCDVSVNHVAPTSNTSYRKWFSLSTCLCLKASWSVNHFGIEWLSVLCVCSSSISSSEHKTQISDLGIQGYPQSTPVLPTSLIFSPRIHKHRPVWFISITVNSWFGHISYLNHPSSLHSLGLFYHLRYSLSLFLNAQPRGPCPLLKPCSPEITPTYLKTNFSRLKS